jgi:hypothetical protein
MLITTLTEEARTGTETVLRPGFMDKSCFIMRDIVAKKKTYNGEEIKRNTDYDNKENLLDRGLGFLD